MNLADPRTPWDDAEQPGQPDCHGCERLPTGPDGLCDACRALPDPFLGPIVAALLNEDGIDSVRIKNGETLLVNGAEYTRVDHGYGFYRVYYVNGEGEGRSVCDHDGTVESIVQAILEVMP